LIPFFVGHGPFLVVVPSGDAVVVVVLSSGAPAGAANIRVAELHLLDPLRPAAPAFFNWDLSYNTASPSGGLSFSLSYSQFSLNYSMYVCVEMRFDFVYYIVVM
jgi:hypothetical protein